MQTQNFNVKGMHCASCSNVIKTRLGKLSGVESCEVNIVTDKAQITYNPNAVSVEDMNNEISKLGYSLSVPEDHKPLDNHVMLNGTMISGMDHEEKSTQLNKIRQHVLVMIPLMVISAFVMAWEIGAKPFGLWPEMPYMIMEFFHHLLPIFATYALFVVGVPYLAGLIRFIKHRVANMDTLVGIGTLSAFVYSFIVTAFEDNLVGIIDTTQVYYDVTIIVIGFITLGKYLEVKSKLKTGEAIEKLLNLQAKTAIVKRDDKEIEISLEEVEVGDLIIVKPGTKVPVDGVIVEGNSSLDESMVSGESMPVDKKIGDSVIGSTINKQGHFIFRATKIGSDTMLAQIIKMVEQAQGSKAPIQDLADKVSAVFVPVVLVIAILTLAIWIMVGSTYLGTSTAISLGLTSFVGILIIACPCALGLATPTAIIVGVGKGAENGILIKDAESLEKLREINTVVLDKTGTITVGKPMVTDFVQLENSYSEEQLIQLAASIEHKSEHPLAQSIVEYAHRQHSKLLTVSDFKALEGVGVEGKIDNKHIFIHKPLKNAHNEVVNKLQSQGKTVVEVEVEKKLVGLIAISDPIKPHVKETVEQLHSQHISVIMLTGDNHLTAQYIAKQAGIDEVIAEVLPQDKANKIKELQKERKIIAMVGDGINDAPALTQADVGIAMATGTDVAIESADIVLLNGDIRKIHQAIHLSKMTVNKIKQNLFWAFIYNVVGIPLAAGVFYPFTGLLLNPIFAGLAMALSSVSVVSNSLLLKQSKL